MIPIVSQAAVRVMTWQLYFNYRERLVDPIMTSWTGNSAMKTILTKGASPDLQVCATMGIAGAMTGATAAVVAGESDPRAVLHIRPLTYLELHRNLPVSSPESTV